MFTKLKSRIFYEEVDGQKIYTGGLLNDSFDARDIKVGGLMEWLGLEQYKPTQQRLVIPNLGIKSQTPHNTCGWHSTATDTETNEKVKLSARGLVQLGKREGFISGNGFSSLRDNMKVVQKFGIPEERYVPEGEYNPNWEEYSKFSLTKEALENAYSHRSQSFAQVNGRNETLKLLDQGSMIHTGCDWYSDFNMRGGFSSPWLIESLGKWLIGGHAFEIAGYDMNYLGREVYVCQNSWGEGWGDNGYFYVPINFAEKFLFSRWVQLDIAVDTARFLIENTGKNVRSKNSKAIWHIENGKKFAFPNWLTFLAYGGLKNEVIIVEDDMLAAIDRGGDMRIETSPAWPLIREMSAPDNYKLLLRLVADPSNTPRNLPQGYTGLSEKDNWVLAEIYDEMLQTVKS